MAQRWLFAAIGVTAMLISGCSFGKTTHTTITHSAPVSPGSSSSSSSTAAAPPSQSTTTETAPVTQLDSSQCVDVTGANVDLLTASDKDAARKAADTLEGYNPPSSVKAAIEHFVTTGGAHFDDPDYTKNNQTLDAWVKQVCPT
ncbi:MAG: hypothetical protein ACLPXZ_27890 [Mycobacterium sp.]